MALTTWTAIDDAECLLVLQVDESKADGAIAQIDVTNRRSIPLTAWGDYARNAGNVQRVEQVVQPGETVTVTFRGANARAGDVAAVGYY